MPPPEWVEDPDERKSMYMRESIKVYNGRLLDPPPTLDANGFQLVDADTQNKESTRPRHRNDGFLSGVC